MNGLFKLLETKYIGLYRLYILEQSLVVRLTRFIGLLPSSVIC